MANQLPVEEVAQLRQQGLSNNQIVQQLQRKGFSAQQIYDAMSQADLAKFSGAPAQQQQQPPQQPPAEMPPPPQPQEYPPQQQAYPQEYQQYPAPNNDERISEIAEAIINEKWEELLSEVKKITDWKDKVDSELKKLSDDFQHLKDQFNELHKGVLGKISEYDEHIRDVGSELKAVEKVFKDVIPSFTQNVGELSKITKTLKKK